MNLPTISSYRLGYLVVHMDFVSFLLFPLDKHAH